MPPQQQALFVGCNALEALFQYFPFWEHFFIFAEKTA
jgi:hypothetical protein